MKKNKNTQNSILRMNQIRVALFSDADNPEKRELIRQLEFQKDLREHLADVIRSIRTINKTKHGDSNE